MENELLVVEESKALQVFKGGNVDPLIEAAKQIVEGFKHDLSTGVGRAKTASLAAKVSKYKVKLDNMGKELTASQKAETKKVDQNRKIIRDQLDELRDQARQPLTDWENAEKERVESHKEMIESLSFEHTQGFEPSEIGYLCDALTGIENFYVGVNFEEFELEANKAKATSIEVLNSLIEKEEDRIKQEQELAQLKKEKEERDQKDYEDKLKRDAAEKATKEAEEKAREESARIEREKQEAIYQKNMAEQFAKEQAREIIESKERAKLVAEKAEENRKIEVQNAVENAKIAQANADQEKKDAIERTKRETAEKQQAEVNRIAQEKKQREADMEHAGNIMRASKECLMKFVDEPTAKKIVLAIKSGKIANVTINF